MTYSDTEAIRHTIYTEKRIEQHTSFNTRIPLRPQSKKGCLVGLGEREQQKGDNLWIDRRTIYNLKDLNLHGVRINFSEIKRILLSSSCASLITAHAQILTQKKKKLQKPNRVQNKLNRKKLEFPLFHK